jgi:hypothetical protein
LEVGGRGGSGVDAAVAVVVGGSEGAGCWARREKNENMVVAGGSVSESLRSFFLLTMISTVVAVICRRVNRG